MQSKPLTFGELEGGTTFTPFPVDGDDAGHGGYRQGGWSFLKLRLSEGKNGENAVRVRDGVLIKFSDQMDVYPVA